MKAINYVGQILSALIYTSIFTGVMYLVVVLPIGLVLSLPWWGILLYLFIGGGIIESIISLLCGIGMYPYVWIAKKNVIATIISIILVFINVIANIINVWGAIRGNGTWAIVFGIIVTVMLLHFIYAASFGIWGLYRGMADDY